MKKTLIFEDCRLAVELTIDEDYICTDVIDISDRYELLLTLVIIFRPSLLRYCMEIWQRNNGETDRRNI